MKKLNKKYLAPILGSVLIIGFGTYIGFKYLTSNGSDTEFAGPTAQDIRDAEENKSAVERRKQIEEDAKNDNRNNSDLKKQVTPQIVNANQSGNEVFISATISGVFESGGTCTMTATLGNTVVKRISDGFADATTTSCTPFRLEKSDFAINGTWSILIGYSSSSAEGTSQARQLVIQ